MSLDKELLEGFFSESVTLVSEMNALLDEVEDNFSKVEMLADYGNKVDRIMGAAKSLCLLVSGDHPLFMISDYTALCKAVGYQASQIKNNQHFFDICVALLMDATDMLSELLGNLDKEGKELRESIPQAFIERLRWVSNQFSKTVSVSVGITTQEDVSSKMQQDDIDALLKKLGI